MMRIRVSGLCLALLCGQIAAAARTITVGKGGGYEYSTIQAAMDAASGGDTVLVSPGTYRENIQFHGKSIMLRSTDPTSAAVVRSTSIEAATSNPVVTFAGTETASCLLSGFTIRGGYAPFQGGGISGQGTLAQIADNVITGNVAISDGAGIALCHGDVRNNEISWNAVWERDGGGLFGCNGTISDNIISSNWVRSGYGGGLNSCAGTIRHNTISGNYAPGGGAGLSSCTGEIVNNLILGNYSAGGGAGLYRCDGVVRKNVIVGNTAPGDLLYFSGARGAGLRECRGVIANNVIRENDGSGLSNCDGLIRNNLILGNTAVGLYHCKNIQNNTVVGNHKGLSEYCQAITNCIFWDNTDEMYSYDGFPSFSCIQNWSGLGTGNIALDPKFVDPNGPDGDPNTYEDNDYHLSPDSPCIDAGDPAPEYDDTALPPGQKTPRNDMGAFGGPDNYYWLSSPFIVIRQPNGGETFNAGTLQEPAWDFTPEMPYVDVFFLYRSGGTLQTLDIARRVVNTHSVRWIVPDTLSDECYIRVADSDNPATSDTSDAPFRIVAEPRQIRVLSPNGGEIFYWWRQTLPITWVTTGTSSLVGIHFSTDGGATWNLLDADLPNSGSFTWTFPEVNSDQCLISVFDAGDPSYYDMSDRPFMIYEDSDLTRPNLRFAASDFSPSAPTQARPGDPFALSVVIENAGKTPSGRAWFEVWGSRTGGITLDCFLCDSKLLDSIPGSSQTALNATETLYSVPDGPYTVVYVLDRTRSVYETIEGDNRAVVAGKRLLVIRPPKNVNLVIEQFGVTPNPLLNYGKITFGGWVRNTGTEDSGTFWIEFWGSINRITPQLDFPMCDSIRVQNLGPGESIFLGYYERRLYQSPTGTFMAGVYLDRVDEVNETNETDNYAFVDGIGFNQEPSAAPGGAVVRFQAEPDLAVLSGDFSPAAPTVIAPGSPIRISGRLLNQGVAAAGPFWLEFWGSRLGGLSLNEFVCDSMYVPHLDAGRSLDVSLSVPMYSMPDGPYTLTVVADRANLVTESNKRNNRLAVAGKRILTIRPQTQANLRTERFAVSATTLHLGQPLGISGEVRNSGSENSGAFWIEFWGSFDQMYPNLDYYLCDSAFVANLSPGDAVDLAALPLTLRSNAPGGPCMILCFPDRPDSVNETDESDNVRAIAGCRVVP